MNNCDLKKSSIIDVQFGNNVKVIEPVNIYKCKIEDDVFIGPFVEIQSNVIIKKNTKVQSHSFICEKVQIGEKCFIGHGVMFTNDDFKLGGPSGKNNLKKTIVGNNVSIGSNATILPVTIANNIVIGAGSVVTKNLEKKGIYAGNPAKLIRDL